jgi:hypothetical protein
VSPGCSSQSLEGILVLAVILSMAIALATTLLQGWLRIISREPPADKRIVVSKEDLIWWADWVVSGSLTLAVLLLYAAKDHKEISFKPLIITFLSLFLGYSALPFIARMLIYDKDGEIKEWWYIAIANILGALILLGTVAGGATLITGIKT